MRICKDPLAKVPTQRGQMKRRKNESPTGHCMRWSRVFWRCGECSFSLATEPWLDSQETSAGVLTPRRTGHCTKASSHPTGFPILMPERSRQAWDIESSSWNSTMVSYACDRDNFLFRMDLLPTLLKAG